MDLEIKTFASTISSFRWSMFHARTLAVKQSQIVIDKDFMGIVFNLSDTLNYEIDSVGKGTINGLHFAVVNTPAGTCRLTVPKGIAELFSVQLDPAICKKCQEEYPFLSNLTKCQNHQRAISLSTIPVLATPAMIDIVFEIKKEIVLGSLYNDKLSELYLASKGSQLFLLSMTQINLTLARNLSFLN